MKTNQLMQRDFDGNTITQRTDNSFLNATDLLRVYNETSNYPKRIVDFLSNQNTGEFIDALIREESEKVVNLPLLKTDLYKTTKGRKGTTYMHPYLFVKFAMWLSPNFEVKVIKWVYDNLIKVRHEAGDHYLEMVQIIKDRYTQWSGSKKIDPLIFIREANYLKELAFGYKNKSRNEATEAELKLLSALQKANIKLINQKVGKDQRYIKLRDFAILYSDIQN